MTLAMGFMVVLLVIAAGVHSLVLAQLSASGGLRQRVTATELAEGGLARVRAWFDQTSYRLPAANLVEGAAPVRLRGSGKAVVLPDTHPDAYTDTQGSARKGIVASYGKYLSSQRTAAGDYSVTATLIATQPETWEAVATAAVGNVQRVAGVVLAREQSSLFADALFGRSHVRMNGNARTDSYDASLGAYGGANVFKTGNVRSNGDIDLIGNALVQGDAISGPKGSVGTKGNAGVTGLSEPADREKELPPVVVPAGAVSLGKLKLTGKHTQTLTSGTYVASELDIGGNAQLIIDASAGPVNLYVTGEISLGGNGVANASGQPKNFNLVQVGGADVDMTGNTDFVGTVYAPDSELEVKGNGDIYGAIIAASVDLVGNADVHFDQSLRTIGNVPGPMRVLAQWRQ